MYILGINIGRNTAAALLKDGEILVAAEEERFIREKGTIKFPINAIKFCLKSNNLDLKAVDYITFSYDFSIGIFRGFLFFLRYFPKTIKILISRFKTFREKRPAYIDMLLKNFDISRKELNKKVKNIEHHIAHGAAAYYVSGFESAAILSIDGAGEIATTMLGKASRNSIEKLKEVYFPHSLGFLYNTFTQFLGFRIDNGEGKVMGLAPYGKAVYKDIFDEIIKPLPNGGYKMNMSYFRYHFTGNKKENIFSKKVEKIFGKPRIKEGELTERDKNIAATLQYSTEKIGIHLANYLYKITNNKNLCISGGVALNSVMNYQIMKETPFENVFIYPASSDAGTAMGSALYYYFNVLKNEKKSVNSSPYLGPEFSNSEIEDCLKKHNLKFKKMNSIDDLTEKAADAIYQGKIIGWFQGRMEIGPRALGNRSIITAPYPAEMKDILNQRVKFREGFRPFAPAVKIESYKDYFDIDSPSPYMLMVAPIKSNKIDKVAAIAHVDKTARLQTVKKEDNPRYWMLIDKFEKKSGIPVILNTSFNVRGEPIVCTPADGINCFIKTDIDVLFIGDYVVEEK